MGIKEEAVGEAINLGSGKVHRVIDLANMVNELAGQTLRKFNHQTFKKGLIQTLFFRTFKKFNQQTFRKSLTKNAAQASRKETFTKETKRREKCCADGIRGWIKESA